MAVTNVLEYLRNKAETYPDKTAVMMRDNSLSFSELDDLSARIAAVIPEDVKNRAVAVMASRGIEPLVFFMAALYSGNYYIPIDPDMPKEKMLKIFNDSGATVVLGIESFRELVGELLPSATFLTEKDADEKRCEIPSNGGDDPAYIIYTSGSTGTPKGVIKSHGGIINYIETYQETFKFSSDDIIGNQTPFFFDASAKDIYLSLKTGATLDIIPSELFSTPKNLIEHLNEKKITFISWVPTALCLVSQFKTFKFVIPETVKRVFFIGEVMPVKHLNEWRSALPDVQFVNLFGSSEIAGFCCYYDIKTTFADDASLPIGKALPNCEVYLLDGDEIINEPDRTGEIYIVSDALARGYFNNPEKTAECFMTKDFGNGLVRCFKSGDLARYDADGNLRFAARTDFQVKHLGHRVELGEIETAAGSLSELRACCCVYDHDKSKIVLFCELADGVEISARDLRALLGTKLSVYMVPNKVIFLDRLPLNPNGKIDRAGLVASLKK